MVETVRGLPDTGAGIVAIGFCFGGLCALDLARSGADIAGAASFHGIFDPPGLRPQPIRAKVIAFHGWDDPMVPPAKVVALGRELTEAGCDWQIHAFGDTRHGFTNPGRRQARQSRGPLQRRCLAPQLARARRLPRRTVPGRWLRTRQSAKPRPPIG